MGRADTLRHETPPKGGARQGKRWLRVGSNHRPYDYESYALTN